MLDLLCGWNSDDDGTYHTGCGQLFVLNDGTPRENGMRFCCYCGGGLRQGKLYPPSRQAKTTPKHGGLTTCDMK